MTQQSIYCWDDTKNICNKYVPPPPKSIKYVYDNTIFKPTPFKATTLSITNIHIIDCGLSLIQDNPVLLNAGHETLPGGYVDKGYSGKEESIFRRTNCFQTLHISLYPIKSDELIYSSNISVIKTIHWKYIHEPYKLSFITCPVLNNNMCITKKEEQLLGRKINHILQTALYHGHHTIILTTLCDDLWYKKIQRVAYIYKEVLSEYMGVFKHIEFALNGDNYHIFKEVFKH
tara:strand:+ start:2498 stop:3190 length:693 start_codon:yes stop_codon:yes gene_type:complete